MLKDQQALTQAEKVLKEFKPVDYDLEKWNGVVDAFEGKAVSGANRYVIRLDGLLGAVLLGWHDVPARIADGPLLGEVQRVGIGTWRTLQHYEKHSLKSGVYPRPLGWEENPQILYLTA